MTDFLKIAKSIVVHFAHICAYGVETVKITSLILRKQENYMTERNPRPLPRSMSR